MARHRNRGPKSASLTDISKALKIHPRTVLRAVSGKPNAYWAEGYETEIALVDVAMAYDADLMMLQDVVLGDDELMKQDEAVEWLAQTYGDDARMSSRNFRYRGYPAAVRSSRVVRFSQIQLGDYHIKNFTR